MASILVVDDRATNRAFLVTLLGYQGHRLLEAGDGAEALDLVRAERPDLVITDILMPTMDGYEFVRRLRADSQVAGTAVMFYTAHYHSPKAKDLAKRCGVSYILPKPCEPELVLRTVEQALGAPMQATQPQSGEFDQEHLRLVTDKLAETADDLRATNQRLAALIAINLQLASEREPRQLLEKVCHAARDLIGAKYALLAVENKDRINIGYVATSGMDGATADRLGHPALREGVVGRAAAERMPYRLADVGGPPENVGLPSSHPPVHSFLVAPIVSLAHVYGWICLTDKLGADEFSEEDEQLLAIHAAQVGRVYENGNLYAELHRHATRLEAEVVERGRREEDLRRFRAAIDATADGIFLIDRATGQFVDVNDTACRMLGYTRDELLKLNPADPGVGTIDKMQSSYDSMAAAIPEMVEITLRRKDGSLLPVELSRRIQRLGEGWIIVGVARDITERKEAEQRLLQLAHYDTLTGLPNRTLFYESLKRAFAQAEENYWIVSVLFLDVDRFKNVNDTLGHAIGDVLLRQVGNRLVSCLRIRDTVGRLGGDEFGLILITPDGPQGAEAVANKIREVLRPPFTLEGRDVTVTASIGITVYPADSSDPGTLIKYADTAMYQAKEAGRDTYRFYTAEMNVRALEKLELEDALRKALQHDEFVLYYQPKMEITTGRWTGVEALIRWNRPGHGLVLPADFIPVLEETGLIMSVGEWVIDTACRQIAEWQRSSMGPLRVAINLSGKQFLSGFDSHIARAAHTNRVDPKLLELELTETTLMTNAEGTTAVLERLKALGMRISIDDFGTGYSSLAYLRRFPIDTLKIDLAFICGVTTNADDAAITVAIINMAHSLKLKVIAEGVETREQLEFLHAHNCDEIQGYYLSPPLPAAELVRIQKTHGGAKPIS